MNSIVHPNVLEGVGVLQNVVIKMLAPLGAPLQIRFFFYQAEGVTLEMGRGGEDKGPLTQHNDISLVRFDETTSGAAMQISSYGRPSVFPDQHTQYVCQSLLC